MMWKSYSYGKFRMKIPVFFSSFLGRTSVPQKRNSSVAGATEHSPEPTLEKPPAVKISEDVPSFYAGLERTYKPLKGEGHSLKQALSEHPAVPDVLLQYYYKDNLINACKSGNLQKVQRLLAEVSGFSEQAVIASAFKEAIQNGHAAVVEKLLAAPGKIGNNRVAMRDALLKASENGHAAVVEKLLAAPCQIGNISIALNVASGKGYHSVVQLLRAI